MCAADFSTSYWELDVPVKEIGWDVWVVEVFSSIYRHAKICSSKQTSATHFHSTLEN